jgi:Ice-binding-like
MFNLSRRTRVWVFVGLAACAVFIAGANPQVGQASDPLLQATLSVPPRVTLPTVAPKAPKAPKAVAPSLGAAASFAVLGFSTVTNTGPAIITGDLGLSPGTSITGFPPGLVIGTIHVADAVALQAQTDTTAAYNALESQPCNFNLSGQDLGGLTLTPGVYCFNSSAQLTGQLTLTGLATDVWVFRIGSTLTTASASSVVVTGSASPCNVFWQVGSSATLGTASAFKGNILALASITVTTGATLSGRALARNGAVTLDTNNVSAVCPAAPGSTPTPIPPAATLAAIAATLTAIPPMQTVIAATLAPSLTAAAATLVPSLTAIAATRIAIAPTQTAIAATLAPSLTAIAAMQTVVAARTPTPVPPVPARPAEVPEGDTLLLFGGGIGGLATWIGWQWRKVRARSKQ